jgi:hypothetical protein
MEFENKVKSDIDKSVRHLPEIIHYKSNASLYRAIPGTVRLPLLV